MTEMKRTNFQKLIAATLFVAYASGIFAPIPSQAHTTSDENTSLISRTEITYDGRSVEIVNGTTLLGEEDATADGLVADMESEYQKDPNLSLELAWIDLANEGRTPSASGLESFVNSLVSRLSKKNRSPDKVIGLTLNEKDTQGLNKIRSLVDRTGKAITPKIESAFNSFNKTLEKIPSHHWFKLRLLVPGVSTVIVYYFVKDYEVMKSLGGLVSTLSGSFLIGKIALQLNDIQKNRRIWNWSPSLKKRIEKGVADEKFVYTKLEKTHSLFNFGVAEAAFGGILYFAEQGWRMCFGIPIDAFEVGEFSFAVVVSTLSQGAYEDALATLREIMVLEGKSPDQIAKAFTRLSAFGSITSVTGFKVMQTVNMTAGLIVLGTLGVAGFSFGKVFEIKLKQLKAAQDKTKGITCPAKVTPLAFISFQDLAIA